MASPIEERIVVIRPVFLSTTPVYTRILRPIGLLRKSKGQQLHADPEEHRVQPTEQTLQQEIKLVHNAVSSLPTGHTMHSIAVIMCVSVA
jgi:hypothetical protein